MTMAAVKVTGDDKIERNVWGNDPVYFQQTGYEGAIYNTPNQRMVLK